MNARKLYREFACVREGCLRAPSCFAHYPKHRGIGGKNAGWGLFEGAPLCDYHHKILDGQKPGGMSREEYETEREAIIGSIWLFWVKMLDTSLVKHYDTGPPERVAAVEAFAVREIPAYRRRKIGLVNFPPFSPGEWTKPPEVDMVWSFDEDGEGAVSIDVDVDTGV